MKLIYPTTEFKHDSQTFYPGEARFVSEDDAAYFQKHGWATDDPRKIPDYRVIEPAELDVQNGKHPSKSPTVG